MDQFVFLATLVGMLGSLCTIAGFLWKVIERRRDSHSNNDQK